MKYQLLGENDYTLDPINQVLKNRNIEDTKTFIKPKASSVIHWSKLRNMDKAVTCLIEHVKKGGEAFIQVDADP